MSAGLLLLTAVTASSATWQLDCRLMKPVGPNIEKVGRGELQFDRIGEETFIEIVSEDFPEFTAGRQLLVNGAVTDADPAEEPAWIVRTASGRRAFETKSHGSRNGRATGILISSYEMTTIGSLPEDFFEYNAAGLCRSKRGTTQ